MKEKKLTLKQAKEFVKAKRNIINPNRGFLFQLIKFERLLFPDLCEPSMKLYNYWGDTEPQFFDKHLQQEGV
jgi:hypothetical protein